MKSIIVLAAFLFNISAYAGPVKGDLVRYKVTTTSHGHSQILEQKIEVTGVDANKGTYTTTVTITYNGNVVSQSNEESDLNSANESENTLDHCADMPSDMASIETITVPAGTFKVCHIKTSDGGSTFDQYLGKVLFGLVKNVLTGPYGSTTMELIEVQKH